MWTCRDLIAPSPDSFRGSSDANHHLGLVPFSHPNSLGYACTLYTPTPPLPIEVRSTIRHENITYPKKIFSNYFPITVSRFRFFRINLRKLRDTYCICVSCVALPGWDPCPCRIIFYYRYPIWIFPNYSRPDNYYITWIYCSGLIIELHYICSVCLI